MGSFWRKAGDALRGKGKLGWIFPGAKLAREARKLALKGSRSIRKRVGLYNPHSATSYTGVADYGSTGSIVGKV